MQGWRLWIVAFNHSVLLKVKGCWAPYIDWSEGYLWWNCGSWCAVHTNVQPVKRATSAILGGKMPFMCGGCWRRQVFVHIKPLRKVWALVLPNLTPLLRQKDTYQNTPFKCEWDLEYCKWVLLNPAGWRKVYEGEKIDNHPFVALGYKKVLKDIYEWDMLLKARFAWVVEASLKPKNYQSEQTVLFN